MKLVKSAILAFFLDTVSSYDYACPYQYPYMSRVNEHGRAICYDHSVYTLGGGNDGCSSWCCREPGHPACNASCQVNYCEDYFERACPEEYPYLTEWPEHNNNICYSSYEYATGTGNNGCQDWCCLNENCSASCTVQRCSAFTQWTIFEDSDDDDWVAAKVVAAKQFMNLI